MCSAEKMNMISVHTHCLYLYFISLFYACGRFSDDLNNFFVEKRFPVLDRKNNMVMNLPCTMVPFSDSAFIIHPYSITKTPCSELQGTFKLEDIGNTEELVGASIELICSYGRKKNIPGRYTCITGEYTLKIKSLTGLGVKPNEPLQPIGEKTALASG